MRHSTRARAAFVVAATASLVLAACSAAGPGGSGAPSGGAIAHPTGADDLVFGLSYEGGLLPVEAAFGQLPTLTVAGDGRVIAPGAQIELYPGPALPAVQARRMSEAGIQLLLERLASTGFFAESATFTEEALAIDAPLTVFTLNADGREVVVRVGALGLYRTEAEMPPTMTARERQAHLALVPLLDELTAIDQMIPDSAWEETEWHAHVAESLRLLVSNRDGEPLDPGIPATEVPWPGAGDPASFGEPYPPIEGARCGVVDGEEATTWYESLGAANQLTRFTAAGHSYQVAVRPVLPGEPAACVVGQPAG